MVLLLTEKVWVSLAHRVVVVLLLIGEVCYCLVLSCAHCVNSVMNLSFTCYCQCSLSHVYIAVKFLAGTLFGPHKELGFESF